MTDHTLLPCPFCGGEAELLKGDPGLYSAENHLYHALKAVVCDQCISSSGWYLHEEEAIAAWNRRTPPAAGHEPWGWLCNGKGDGWEERDKVVRDPGLIARYRERPDLWRIEPLYLGSPPAAVPDGWLEAMKIAEKALHPFYAAVFNDNGDMTVSGGYPYHEAIAGYHAYKRVRSMISAAPAAPTEARDE